MFFWKQQVSAHTLARAEMGVSAHGRVAQFRETQGPPDFAEVKGSGVITKAIADAALLMLDVDPSGFDVMDRKLLEAVLYKFDGGPVGIDNLAAAIGEERDTIEDVLEPYLIQQGYLQRTSRGRIATRLAYEHFGLTPPNNSANLDLLN